MSKSSVVPNVWTLQYAPISVPVAMLAGFCLTVFFYLLPNTPGDFAERFLPFVAAIAILVCWPLTKRRPASAPKDMASESS